MALLTVPSGASILPATQGLTLTDAILNVQASGRVFASPRVLVNGTAYAGQSLSFVEPLHVQVDVRDLADCQQLVLRFDLLGLGAPDSRVHIDEVLLHGGTPPVAADDHVQAEEDTPIVLDILTNDADADGDLDPASVRIVTLPQHGALSVDAATGILTYVPGDNYSGPDSLVYEVADTAGLVSNAATVWIEIIPVTDQPWLSVRPAMAQQDHPVPLEVFARLGDPDGSEQLMVEIASVPYGARLSAGLQTNPGVYRLSPRELDRLTITPPPGATDSFSLQVMSVATEHASGTSAASPLQDLHVEVVPVLPDPLYVEEITINGGQSQRSTIQRADLRFSRDVYVQDWTQSIRVKPLLGAPIALGRDDYRYDRQARTLSLDLTGKIAQDDHYEIQLVTAGIASATARNVTLADIDADPGDGVLSLRFHRLLADFDGNDWIDRADFDMLGTHYHSQPGDPAFDPAFDLNDDRVIDRWDYALWRTRQGLTSDHYAPAIAVALANDTGRSSTDRITRDPQLVGFVGDTSEITRATVTWNGGTPLDILSRLDRGVFQLTAAQLAELTGGPLPDGTHELVVVASDRFGNQSAPYRFELVLDTTAPTSPRDAAIAARQRQRPQPVGCDYERDRPRRSHQRTAARFVGAVRRRNATQCAGRRG